MYFGFYFLLLVKFYSYFQCFLFLFFLEFDAVNTNWTWSFVKDWRLQKPLSKANFCCRWRR